MSLISHPLPMRWRITASAFLLHFFGVTAYIFVFLCFLFSVSSLPFLVRNIIRQTTLPSDGESLSDLLGPVGTLIFFLTVGVLSIMLFLTMLIAAVFPPLRHHSVPRGLDPAVTKTVVYSSVGEASLQCAVCLNYFKGDETLLIPKCDHAFHPDCIGKWLASHNTCPVCRANLASLPAVHLASQLAKSGTEPSWVEVKVEAAPPDSDAPERSPREGRREQIQPPDLGEENESGSFNNLNQTRGAGGIGKFPRSHSTGHSLIRPSEDTERFTPRLPAEVRKQLTDRPRPVLPLEPCSSQGYRCGGEGSNRGMYFWKPDQLDWAAKSERWAFDRILPRVAADKSGGSSGGSV